MSDRRIFLALPILNESKNLAALIDCLLKQERADFLLIACVNNYEHWWEEPELRHICLDNQESIKFLGSVTDLEVQVIDRSSPGKGWPKKKGGVGWARKVAMDRAAELGNERDLIISIDADTYYPPNYIQEIVLRFDASEQMTGLALPYFHQLTNDETDRLILRYELYMRYYLLNMLTIDNPYAFTAVGSAMANTMKAYRRIGGITPVKSGEDFYFLQKLSKNGLIGIWADTVAYPSSRFSNRVIFGTGPALIKGAGGDWNSYPFYEQASFRKVQETFNVFPKLFEKDLPTPMDEFIAEQFKELNIWEPLRKNFKDRQNFIKACEGKIDGLRILQYLRKSQQLGTGSNEYHLNEFVHHFLHPVEEANLLNAMENLDFETTEIADLDSIRNALYHKENELRKERDSMVFNVDF